MKNTQSTDICADQIDIIPNFAVTTNIVIKRVHCIVDIVVMSVFVGILQDLNNQYYMECAAMVLP